MQNPNLLQFRYLYLYYYWVDVSVWWTVSPRGYSPALGYWPEKNDIILKTYNIKSLEIHKTKENLPRAKLCP